MKKFEIFSELPNCDIETQSSKQVLLENGAYRLAQGRVVSQTFNLLKKKKKRNSVSVKCNKVKHNEMRCAIYIYINVQMYESKVI